MADATSRYGIVETLNNRKIAEREALSTLEEEADKGQTQYQSAIAQAEKELASKKATYKGEHVSWKKLKELEKKNQELQKAVEDAQARKAEKLRLAQAESKNVALASPETPTTQVSGSKADWLRASVIPEQYWGLVDQIVQKESSWNPNAVNASSGACGLGQQLPCGKWGGTWNDPVQALNSMNSYVNRYNGWQGAWEFWQANQWY